MVTCQNAEHSFVDEPIDVQGNFSTTRFFLEHLYQIVSSFCKDPNEFFKNAEAEAW